MPLRRGLNFHLQDAPVRVLAVALPSLILMHDFLLFIDNTSIGFSIVPAPVSCAKKGYGGCHSLLTV